MLKQTQSHVGKLFGSWIMHPTLDCMIPHIMKQETNADITAVDHKI